MASASPDNPSAYPSAYRSDFQGAAAQPKLFAWVVIGLFAVTMALLGGTSRADAVQIVALRPLAALFLIPALYCINWKRACDVSGAKVLVALLTATMVWTAVQLVPLPPALWQALPDRDAIAALDQLAGLEGQWRPISMVPTRGYNALASLIVPLSALLVAIAMKLRTRDLLLVIAALAVFDAGLGMAQVASGEGSVLYFYANSGSAAGIFANENHSAVFSALSLLVIVRLGLDKALRAELPGLRAVSVAAFLLVLLSVLISGSRAGIVTGLAAIAGCAVMGALAMEAAAMEGGRAGARSSSKNKSRKPTPKWMPVALASHPSKVAAAIVVLLAALVALFVLNDRTPGLDNIMRSNLEEGLRWQLWPALEAMLAAHWLAGTGFGSFQEAYHIYETNEMLLPAYFNHAHNDWAQLVIEGGVVMVAVLGALLWWIGKAAARLYRSGGEARVRAAFWIAVFAIIMAASLVDYPVRMPAFQAIAIWLLLALALEKPPASFVAKMQ